MVLDGKELLESALANVHFCSDATWVENEYQRRNRDLLRSVKIMQNVIDDKGTDAHGEKATPGTGSRTVRQTIPFSRLATYGNYEYDEGLERLHEPVTEPTQYESNFSATESTEPWMMREVEDLFKHYTSDTSGQHNIYESSFLGPHLLSPWNDKTTVESSSKAIYGTNVALPHYASTPRASEAEEELHRHVYSAEQRRSWEEHSSTLSAHRRTICRPSGSRATSSPIAHRWNTDEPAYEAIPLPKSKPASPVTAPYLKTSPWNSTPRTNSSQVSPSDERCIAKDFDGLSLDVLDGSFGSSNSSSPMRPNSQYYFPSSSESMHEEELFPYRQTPVNTPPRKCIPSHVSPTFQIPVINSETCPMPGPSRPPPGFSKKISVYQRPREYYTYPEKRTHGANFNNLIYLQTQDGQENNRRRGGPYAGLLNVPLLETDTSTDRSLVREIAKSAHLFDREFPSLSIPSTSADQEVPSCRPSTMLESKEFPALAKSPVDRKLSMASAYTAKGKDFLSSPNAQTSETSDRCQLQTSPIMPPRDYNSYNNEFLWPESQDIRNRGTEGRGFSSDRDQSWLSQGATPLPTSIERFSETDRKRSGAQNYEPAFGNPLTLPSYENHVTWLNQHYARRAKTFHHVLQLTDELTTIEQQLDEEMEQSLRARRDAEGESPSTQLELEKDFPPIMGTPKRVQKRRKKPDDMSQSSDWAKSSGSFESLRNTALDYGLYCRRSYKDVCANKSDIQNSTYDSLMDYDLETDVDCRNEDDPNEINVDLSWVDRLLEDEEEHVLETDGGSKGRSELMKELYSREFKKMLMELEDQRVAETAQEEAESRTFETEWNIRFDKLIAEMGEHGMGNGAVERSPAVEVEKRKDDTDNSPKGESITRENETPVEFQTKEKPAPTEKESAVETNDNQGNGEVVSENFQQPGSSPSKLSDENIALKYQGLEKHALGKQKCRKDKEGIIPNESPNVPTPTCTKGKQKKQKNKKKDESRKLTLEKQNRASKDSKEEKCPASPPTTATSTPATTPTPTPTPTPTSPRPTSPQATSTPTRTTPSKCRRRLEFVVQPPRPTGVSSDESDKSEEDCPKIVLVRGSGLLVKEIARTRRTRAKPETPEVVEVVESKEEIHLTPSCSETTVLIELIEILEDTCDTPETPNKCDILDTPNKLHLTPSNTSVTSLDNADKTTAKPTWMKQQRKKPGGGKKKRKGPKPLPVNQRDEFWSYITFEYQHLEKLLQYDVLYVLARREGALFVDNYTQTDHVFNDLEVNDDGSDVIAEVAKALAIVENGIVTFTGDDNYDVGAMPLESLSLRFAEKREQLYRQNAMHVHYGTCHVLRLLRDTRKYRRTEVKDPPGLCLPITDEYAKSIIACGGYPKQTFFQTLLHSRQTEHFIEKLKGLTSVYSFPSAKMINKDHNAVIDLLLECLEPMHSAEEFFSGESFVDKETQTGMSTKQISKCKILKILEKKLFEPVVENVPPATHAAPQSRNCCVCNSAGSAPSIPQPVPCSCANKSSPQVARDSYFALNIPPMSNSLTVDLPAFSSPTRFDRRRPHAPTRALSTTPESEPTCPAATPGEPVYKLTRKCVQYAKAAVDTGRTVHTSTKLQSKKPQVSLVKPTKSILKPYVPLEVLSSAKSGAMPIETKSTPITADISSERRPPLLPEDEFGFFEKVNKMIRKRISRSAPAPRNRAVAHAVLADTSSDARPSQRARRFRSAGSRTCRAASALPSSPITTTCEDVGRRKFHRILVDDYVDVNSSGKKMGPNGEGLPCLVTARRCPWYERSPVRKPPRAATNHRATPTASYISPVIYDVNPCESGQEGSFRGLCANFQRAVCRPSASREITREQPETVANIRKQSLRDPGVVTCQSTPPLCHESLKTMASIQTQAISDIFQQTQLAHDRPTFVSVQECEQIQRALKTVDQANVSKQMSVTIEPTHAVGVASKQKPEVSLITNGVSGLTHLPIVDVSMNPKQIVPGNCSPVKMVPSHVNQLASEPPRTMPLPTQSSLNNFKRSTILVPPPPCETKVEVQAATLHPPLPRTSFLHQLVSDVKPRTKMDILCARRRCFPKQGATTEPPPAGWGYVHSEQSPNDTPVSRSRFQDVEAGRDQSSSGKSNHTFFGTQKELLPTATAGAADVESKDRVFSVGKEHAVGGAKAVATRKKKKGGTTDTNSCGGEDEVKKKDDACTIS